MKIKLNICIALFLMSLGLSAQIDRSVQPKPGPAPKIDLKAPQEFQLKNGLTVLVVENHKLPRVSFNLTIDNPPITEGDKAGMSSLLGSMLGNGTLSIAKDDFNEEIDFLGANLGFSASGGFASSLSKYTDRILELMADAAINPLLTAEEFQKEKDKLLEGLKTQEKDVSAIASRVGSALAYGTDHPYGEFVSETTVNNVAFNDVKRFYNNYFKPNSAYLVVIGDVDVKKVKKAVKKYFKNWEKADAITISVPEEKTNVSATEINFIDMPNATQSNISLTNNVDLEMKDADYHSVLIANKILGGGFNSYLNMNLREAHGYTYGARSSVGVDKYAARFRAGAKVRNMVTDSAIVETLKEIKRIKNEDVADDALKNAKAKYMGDFVLALERPSTIARYALNIKLNDLPQDFYSTYLAKINAVSKADVKRVANQYFKAENARFVVVGKGSEILENLEKTGVPVKHFTKTGETTEKPTYEIPIPNDVDVNVVLNKYITAIGGLEKLNSVNSVLITAEAELQPGVLLEMELKKTNKQQFMQEIKAMGNSVSKQVLDGDTGYMVVQGQRKDLAGDDLKEVQAESSPFPEVNLLNGGATLEKIEKVDGKNAYRVKVSDKKTYFYDVATGLKIQEVTSTPMGSSTISFSDYKEIFGVQFPFKLTQTMGPRKFDFKVKEVKVNEGVKAADFN